MSTAEHEVTITELEDTLVNDKATETISEDYIGDVWTATIVDFIKPETDDIYLQVQVQLDATGEELVFKFKDSTQAEQFLEVVGASISDLSGGYYEPVQCVKTKYGGWRFLPKTQGEKYSRVNDNWFRTVATLDGSVESSEKWFTIKAGILPTVGVLALLLFNLWSLLAFSVILYVFDVLYLWKKYGIVDSPRYTVETESEA